VVRAMGAHESSAGVQERGCLPAVASSREAPAGAESEERPSPIIVQRAVAGLNDQVSPRWLAAAGEGSGFRVQGSGFRVEGAGFKQPSVAVAAAGERVRSGVRNDGLLRRGRRESGVRKGGVAHESGSLLRNTAGSLLRSSLPEVSQPSHETPAGADLICNVFQFKRLLAMNFTTRFFKHYS